MNKITIERFISAIGIIGLVLLGAGVSVYIILNLVPIWLKICFGLGVIFCLIYLGYNWEIIREKIIQPKTLMGTNTTIFILIIFGILSLMNYLGTRYHHRIDLTKMKKYTLSEQTKNLLNQLMDNLDVKIFYSREHNPYYDNVRSLLHEYNTYSNKVRLEYIDPDIQPGLTREYNAREGLTIMEYQGKRESVTGFDERDFSTAILKLIRQEGKKIYFLTGHGEMDIDDFDSMGLRSIRSELERENYIVDKLNLSIQTTFHDDMSVLVIAGAKTELFPGEIELINRYLDHGGRAFILLNPPDSAGLNELLIHRGIRPDNTIIIDPVSVLMSGDFLTPVIGQYPYHDITRGLPRTIFPLSRSLTISDDDSMDIEISILLETSESSWAKSVQNLRTERIDPNFNPDTDIQGPLPFGITYRKELEQNRDDMMESENDLEVNEIRLVVIGNAHFIGNDAIRMGGNRDLFLNCINWLSGDTELLGIRAKEPEDRSLLLTGVQWRLIGLTSMLFLPGLIVFIGLVVWFRRR